MTKTAYQSAGGERRPIKDGLLLGNLADLSSVRLAGSKCADCGETSLGTLTTCPNCGGKKMTTLPLGNEGTLWTYTVVRHKPPGDYLGPDPFVPFGMGLVELPEKLRVLATLDCPVDDIKVDMRLHFRPYLCIDKQGRETVAFTYDLKSKD